MFAVGCNEWVWGAMMGQPLTGTPLMGLRGLQVVVAGLGLLLLVARLDQALMAFGRRFPRITAMGFGLAACTLFVTIAEGICAMLNEAQAPMRNMVAQSPTGTGFFHSDPLLGLRGPRSSPVRVRLFTDGVQRYDVLYTFDEHARRVTPWDGPNEADQALLFFGGSLTLGEGVGDHQTIPAVVARDGSARAYNYAFSGYGTAQMHAILEARDLRQEVVETDASAIYVFIDAHLDRVVGEMVPMNLWAGGFPAYRLEAGQLIQGGPWIEAHPHKMAAFRFLTRSDILRLSKVRVPPWITEGDRQLVAALIDDSARLFQEQFPEGRFILVLYPGSTLGPQIVDRLTTTVEVLDYTDLFDFSGALKIEGDGHPTPEAHELLANALVRDLRRQ